MHHGGDADAPPHHRPHVRVGHVLCHLVAVMAGKAASSSATADHAATRHTKPVANAPTIGPRMAAIGMVVGRGRPRHPGRPRPCRPTGTGRHVAGASVAATGRSDLIRRQCGARGGPVVELNGAVAHRPSARTRTGQCGSPARDATGARRCRAQSPVRHAPPPRRWRSRFRRSPRRAPSSHRPPRRGRTR